MNIEEFARKLDKNTDTVRNWVDHHYIPGVRTDEEGNYIIPNSARKPYTETRARNKAAIYKSMVKACDKGCGITAELYKISDAEFQSYIQQLLDLQYICSYVEDGVTYYNITPTGAEWMNAGYKETVSAIASGVVSAAVSAITTLMK